LKVLAVTATVSANSVAKGNTTKVGRKLNGNPEIEAIPETQRKFIGEKVTYRLAQRPCSYVILEYRRPVYKLLADRRIVTTPAPAHVLEK
jgi:hypothetical protein